MVNQLIKTKIKNMFYYVYILKSLKDTNNYAGYTTNINQRFAQHNNGQVKSTKNRRPFKLIYFEAFTNKEDAKRREKYFETTDGKRGLKSCFETH